MDEKPPKSADYSALHHEMKPPPNNQGEILGQGAESIVRKYGDHYVIKEIQTTDKEGKSKNPTELTIRKSSEFINSLRQDQDRLLAIYDDQLLETQFITGLDDQENETQYRLQERINGRNASEEMKEIGKNNFREKHRKELLRLLYATKKATVELGMPIDMHGDNIVVENESEKLKIIDFGAPTMTLQKLKDYPDVERRNKSYKHTAKIYSQLIAFEEEMNMTDEERSELSKTYEYGEEEEQQFHARHQAWKDEMQQLGID